MSATATTKIGGLGNVGPNVFSASAAPTTDNDTLNGYAIGDVIFTSAGMYRCIDATTAAAVWYLVTGGPPATGTAERIIREVPLGGGSVFRQAYIDEVKSFTTAASANLTTQLPALSRVKSASLNFDTLIVLSTAVKVGLGTAASPSLLALSGTVLTKNTKTNSQPVEANALLAAATTIQIGAVDTNGAAAGTVTSGSVRARVLYDYITAIANAP